MKKEEILKKHTDKGSYFLMLEGSEHWEAALNAMEEYAQCLIPQTVDVDYTKYRLKQIENVFRLTRNIFKAGKSEKETAYDRSFNKAYGYVNELLKELYQQTKEQKDIEEKEWCKCISRTAARNDNGICFTCQKPIESRQKYLKQLKEQPKEKKEVSDWISVEDRLPSEKHVTKQYNVVLKNGYVSTRFYNPINKLWGLDNDEITHWQPLPKPPSNKLKE